LTWIQDNLFKINEIPISNQILSVQKKLGTPISKIGWSDFYDFDFELQSPVYLVLGVISSFSMLQIYFNFRFPRVSLFSHLYLETVKIGLSRIPNWTVRFFLTCQIWSSARGYLGGDLHPGKGHVPP
jgi:hypothetical protein